MAIQNWIYTLTLGSVYGGKQRERRKSFEIITDETDSATNFATAETEAAALKAATIGFSDANVVSESLSKVTASGSTVTATGNLWFEAIMTLALTNDGSKKANLTMYAPKSGVLNTDFNGVNPTASETLALLLRFKSAQNARLSDGETIRDATPFLKSAIRSVGSGSNFST